MSPEALWVRVRGCFETDDGSLPTLDLEDLSAAEHSAVYETIRRQTRLASDATFWDQQQRRDRKLDEVANAATLVRAEQAAPFHFVVEGATGPAGELPPLGVHIFQDTISIDYRMGSDWNPSRVFGFFTWLSELLSSTRRGTLRPNATEGPPDRQAFEAAWMQFCSDRSA